MVIIAVRLGNKNHCAGEDPTTIHMSLSSNWETCT
jgi:hypothetical protein